MTTISATLLFLLLLSRHHILCRATADSKLCIPSDKRQNQIKYNNYDATGVDATRDAIDHLMADLLYGHPRAGNADAYCTQKLIGSGPETVYGYIYCPIQADDDDVPLKFTSAVECETNLKDIYENGMPDSVEKYRVGLQIVTPAHRCLRYEMYPFYELLPPFRCT